MGILTKTIVHRVKIAVKTRRKADSSAIFRGHKAERCVTIPEVKI
jgi:hypothetical protein